MNSNMHMIKVTRKREEKEKTPFSRNTMKKNERR